MGIVSVRARTNSTQIGFTCASGLQVMVATDSRSMQTAALRRTSSPKQSIPDSKMFEWVGQQSGAIEISVIESTRYGIGVSPQMTAVNCTDREIHLWGNTL